LPSRSQCITLFWLVLLALLVPSLFLVEGTSERSGKLTNAQVVAPLGLIRLPTFGQPIFAAPGDNFDVTCNASSTVTGFSAELRTKWFGIALEKVDSQFAPADEWKLVFRVPQDTPEELYDLTVTCSENSATAPSSVRVCHPILEDSLDVIHLTDTHWPLCEDVLPLIMAEIRNLAPNFVIFTGDLIDGIDDGTSSFSLEQELVGALGPFVQGLSVPVMMVNGNHDWIKNQRTGEDALELWKRYLGEKFQFSIALGGVNFVGVSLNDAQGLSPSELSVMNSLLGLYPDLMTVLCLHSDFRNQLSTIPADLVLVGHEHQNIELPGPPRKIVTGKAYSTPGEPACYRLVHISPLNKSVTAPIITVNETLTRFSQSQWSKENDTLYTQSVVLDNPFNFSRSLTYRFIAPMKSNLISIEGGTLQQTVEGNTTLIYVKVWLEPNSTKKVTVIISPVSESTTYPSTASSSSSLTESTTAPAAASIGPALVAFLILGAAGATRRREGMIAKHWRNQTEKTAPRSASEGRRKI